MARKLVKTLILSVLFIALACTLWACTDGEDPSIVYIEVQYDKTVDSFVIDDFDFNDFTVYCVRANGTTLEVPLDSSMLDEANRELLKSAGVQTITVTYGGLSTSFTIELANRVATSYNVTFSVDGGSEVATQTYQAGFSYGSYNEIPTSKKSGNSLLGWRVNDAVNGEFLTPADQTKFPYAITTHFTLYAVWSANTLSVDFDLCYDTTGTSAVAPVVQHPTAYTGNVVRPEPTPQRAGYKFMGWYTAVSENQGVYEYDPIDSYRFGSRVADKDFTLYAKWDRQEYSIEFSPDFISNTGSFGSTFDAEMYRGINYQADITAYQPDDPHRDNFTFMGWYTDDTYTELYWAPKASQSQSAIERRMPDGNMRLYALWNVEYDYLLNFELKVDRTLRIVSLNASKDVSITHIEIPATGLFGQERYPITEIAPSVFYQRNMISLSAAQGSQLTTIGEAAFDYCSNLATVDLPDTIEYVGNNAFRGTKWLNNWSENNPSQANFITVGKVLLKYVGVSQVLDMNRDSTLPDDITSIAEGAFTKMQYMTTITIADSVKTIESNAFVDCKLLTSIIFTEESELVNLNSNALNGTKWFEGAFADTNYFVISNGVLYAYKGSTSVTSITIPDTVTSINPMVFASFDRIETINFVDESKIGFIGQGAFENTVWLTENDREFVVVNNILVGVNSTKPTIVVPTTVNQISTGAFKNSANYIRHIVLANGMKLNEDSFSYCDQLTSISIVSDDASIDLSPDSFEVFEGSFDIGAGMPDTLKLMVEAEKLNAYKSADIWNFYADSIFALQLVSAEIKADSMPSYFGSAPECDTVEEQRALTDSTLFPVDPEEGYVEPLILVTRNDGVVYEVKLSIDMFYSVDAEYIKDYGYITFDKTDTQSVYITYEDRFAASNESRFVGFEYEYFIEPALLSAVIGAGEEDVLAIPYVNVAGQWQLFNANDPTHAALEKHYSSLQSKYFKNNSYNPVGATITVSYNSGAVNVWEIVEYSGGEITLKNALDEYATAYLNIDRNVKLNGVTLTNPESDAYKGFFYTSEINDSGDYYTYSLLFRTVTGLRIRVTNDITDDDVFRYRVDEAKYYSIGVSGIANDYRAGEDLSVRRNVYGNSTTISLLREDNYLPLVVTSSSSLAVVKDIDTSVTFDENGKLVLGEDEYLTEDGKIRRLAKLHYYNASIYPDPLDGTFEYFVNFETNPDLFVIQTNGTEATISGVSTGYPSILIIPETIRRRTGYDVNNNPVYTDYTVTSISANAFEGRTGIKQVYIPKTVKTIGAGAFRNIIDLERVYFGSKYSIAVNQSDVREFTLEKQELSGLTDIGARAFAGNISLEYFYVVPSVTTLGESVLQDTTSLTYFSVLRNADPSGNNTFGIAALTELPINMMKNSGVVTVNLNGLGLTAIGSGAFDSATSLTTVNWDLNANLNRIANSTFIRTTSLTSIDLPAAVTDIGDYAFSYSSLQSIVIPKNVQRIGKYAFDYTGNLTSVTLAADALLATIDDFAFSHSALTSVVGNSLTLPDSLRAIGAYAFAYTENLSEIDLGAGVDSLGAYCFSNTALTQLSIPGTISHIAEGFCKESTALVSVRFHGTVREAGASIALTQTTGEEGEEVTTTAYYAADNARYIPAHAFSGCTALTTVSFIAGSPNLVKDYAFKNCTNLDWWDGSIGIDGSSFTIIGSNAFAGSGISSLAISDTIVAVGDEAYADCMNITDIAIEKQAENEGKAILKGCQNIATATLNGSISARELFGEDGSAAPYNLKTINISATSTEVVDNAYKGFRYVQNLSFIGNDVVTIGESAFADMSALYSLVIPTSVTEVAPAAFAGASALRSLSMPAHLSFASMFTTDSPGQLGTVTLTLADALNLKKVVKESFLNINTVSEIILPEGLLSIGTDAFKNCSRLLELDIPFTVGSFVPALDGANALETITVPGYASNPLSYLFSSESTMPESLVTLRIKEGSTRVYAGSLNWMSTVNKITIPSTVMEIEPLSFVGCNALNEFEVDSNNTVFVADSGSLYKKSATANRAVLVHYAPYGTNTNYSIASTITEIYDGAFSTAVNLRSVTSKDNKNFIILGGSGGALYTQDRTRLIAVPASTRLSTIGIAEDVVTVAPYAFANVTSAITIEDIEAAKKWTEIAEGAFYNCSGITTFAIPSTITTIGENAFAKMGKQKTEDADGEFNLTVNPANTKFVIVDDVLYELAYTTETSARMISYLNRNYVENYTASQTFNVTNSSVTETYTVTAIDRMAFTLADIGRLVFANVNDQTLSLGDYTFKDSSIGSIVVNMHVIGLDAGAMLGISGLTEVELKAPMSMILADNCFSFHSYTVEVPAVGDEPATTETKTLVLRVPNAVYGIFIENYPLFADFVIKP